MLVNKDQQRRQDFENELREKGMEILDLIFSPEHPLRERVDISNPGEWEARELIFNIKYEDEKDLWEILKVITHWLKDGKNWEKLQELMLF
ncbi:MAG: hypothetical protein AB1546_16215 [bacterium]